MPNKIQSPLVKSVLALDEYFSELKRLGTKINSLDMKNQFECEQAQRLMNRFAECGEGISTEVLNLSQSLNAVRAEAEELAQGVTARSEILNARKTEEQKKMEQFQQLSEKVRGLSSEMAQLKQPAGETLTNEQRANIKISLAAFDGQLIPLIEQAQEMRREAHAAKMKVLEQNADSLAQTLQAVRQKLVAIELPNRPQ